jgi:hypothetical protein
MKENGDLEALEEKWYTERNECAAGDAALAERVIIH